jgi:GTP cyclohydrolase FolE2
VILVDMPTDGATYEKLAEFAHLYTTSGANPDIPTPDTIAQVAKLSNSEILEQFVDKAKKPEEFAFTLDVIENPVEDAVKRLKDKMGIKDVDRTVQTGPVEVNLEAEDGEEEEVLA